MAAMLVAAVLVTITGCGDDPDVVAPPVGAPGGGTDRPSEPSLVGLEVTAAGNVTELVSPIAFRIDKDGTDARPTDPRFDDDDFRDLDLVREDVLVLDVRESDVAVGDAVEVRGTVREFDLAEAERVFDVDLDDQIYGTFRDVLAIVADGVVKQPAASGSSGGTTTTTRSDDPDVVGPTASIVGLEVTASGNVTQVLSPLAFEIDKDGVGGEEKAVFDDEAFDDVELSERHVLVVDAGRTEGLSRDAAVRVSGTIREFDVNDAERLFEVDLDDRLYGPFDEQLVIVADLVEEVTVPSSSSTTTKP